VTAGALVVCCFGMLALNTSGLSGKDQYTKTFDSTRGQELLLAHGLADTSSPLQVVSNSGTGQQVATALVKAGFTPISIPTGAGKPAVTFAPIKGDPSSTAAFDQVRKARAAVHPLGVDAQVTGFSAIALDIGSATDHDTRIIIPLVLLVVFLVLGLLLRSVVAPIMLIATVVLSFGAALGIASVLFKTVFGFAGEDQSFPLFVFVFLVALGIDYNIFLMTRVREETPARGTRSAALVALGATGGVITSAGLVLAATFGMLGTMPLVGFVEIGVAVALGVLLDTLVVRSVLVTALNLDIGPKLWWPARLEPATVAAGEAGELATVK
jgi:RND superfamily putative drug exporter